MESPIFFQDDEKHGLRIDQGRFVRVGCDDLLLHP
jgi:hypothetical protein